MATPLNRDAPLRGARGVGGWIGTRWACRDGVGAWEASSEWKWRIPQLQGGTLKLAASGVCLFGVGIPMAASGALGKRLR